MPGTKNVHQQLGKGNNYREISGKFEVVASTAYSKNTTGTDENLFRLVPVLGHGARILPPEIVPVPGHGAQIRELKQLRRRRQRKRYSEN